MKDVERPRLHDKVALVTGAAAGLGAAIARRFVEEGARVVLGDTNVVGVEHLAVELGEHAHGRRMDVAREQDWRAALDETLHRYGRLDVLVNNAAIVFPAAPVQETSQEDFDRLVAVNARGVYLGLRLAHPHLVETRGCVLNVSSMAGVVGQANHAVYAATKGFVNALTKATAVDWGPQGVRVNALCPTSVWTEAMRRWSEEQAEIEDLDAYFRRLHPLGYCPEAEEIAPVAAFLCSDEARFVTGALMPASGGSECGYR